MNRQEVCARAPRGQTTTEYALIVATVVIVLIAFYDIAGAVVSTLLNQVIPLLG